MIPLSLAQIAEITGAARDPGADPAAMVTGPVVIDSHQVRPGSLFVYRCVPHRCHHVTQGGE